jgi:hypothetical protein
LTLAIGYLVQLTYKMLSGELDVLSMQTVPNNYKTHGMFNITNSTYHAELILGFKKFDDYYNNHTFDIYRDNEP